MGYSPVNWKDFPNEETPLSAVNLNHMDMQIKENADKLETPATVEKRGLVKPDGTTITVDADGTIHGAKGEDSTTRKAIADNWQGKGYNLIPFPYYRPNHYVSNGITFDVDKLGRVKVNGTQTATVFYNFADTRQSDSPIPKIEKGKTYRLSINQNNARAYIRFYNESKTSIFEKATVINGAKEVIFSVDVDFAYVNIWLNIAVASGYPSSYNNDVFEVMLVEVAEDGSYPTEYQRYASGNVELSNKAEIESARISDNWNKGGVNLIPYPYYSSNRHISNGITYTVNADGSVTANGTATEQSRFYFWSSLDNKLVVNKNKKYILLGSINKAGVVTEIAYYNGTNYAGYSEYDNGNGVSFVARTDITYDRTASCIIIMSGTTINNITFYPMLVEVADDGTYPTEYQRYAKGNVELTDTINNVISDAWNSTTTYTVGQYCIYNNTLWRCELQSYNEAPVEGGYYWTAVRIADEVSAITNKISFGHAHEVFHSFNFNDYIKSGFYRINDLTAYTNAPRATEELGSWGQLLVIKNADTVAQLYIGLSSSQLAFRCFSINNPNSDWIVK